MNELNEIQDVNLELEDVALTAEISKEIENAVAKIKADNPKIKVVYPILVMGEEYDEKPYYIAYFKQPNLPTFSKYMSLMQKDITVATKTLANDCFISGDRALIDDDSLFMFGLMAQLPAIIKSRSAKLVNLSKPGK